MPFHLPGATDSALALLKCVHVERRLFSQQIAASRTSRLKMSEEGQRYSLPFRRTYAVKSTEQSRSKYLNDLNESASPHFIARPQSCSSLNERSRDKGGRVSELDPWRAASSQQKKKI